MTLRSGTKIQPKRTECYLSKDKILATFALLCFTLIAARAGAAGSVWSIKIVGLKGEPLGVVTLELTDESASTCMAGEWKKARLINSSFQSPTKRLETKEYFPTYETNDKGLEIQLNPPNVCDAYIFLSGPLTERAGNGDYFSMGLGGASSLGTFTAKRQ